MNDSPKVWRFSGNLFFNFLTESTVAHMKNSPDNLQANKFNQKYLIAMLKKIIFNSKIEQYEINCFEQYATKYKNLNITTFALLEKIFPNNLNECIEKFDEKIRNEYDVVLSNTYDVIKDKISKDVLSIEALVGRTLYAIDKDNTIKDTTEFFILPDGHPISKKSMVKWKEFDVTAFILGIWHYIVMCSINYENKVVGNEENDTYSFVYEPATKTGGKSKIKPLFQKKLIDGLNVRFDVHLNESPQKTDCVAEEDKKHIDSYWRIKYREALRKKYSRTTDPSQNNKLVDFCDIYIENNILPRSYGDRSEEVPFASSLEILKGNYSNRIIITGVAGIGKTMLFKHLLLTAISENYANITQHIPVFVPVEDYKSNEFKLQEYMHSCINSFDKNFTDNNFNTEMQNGKFLFLIDGMERMMRSQIISFIEEINCLIEEYPQNIYIISSRPFYENIILNLHGFTIMEVLPFTKEQSLEMITRLTRNCNQHKKIEDYKRAFENYLYERYHGINDNPMLLAKIIEIRFWMSNTFTDISIICRGVCDKLLPPMLMTLNRKIMLETRLPCEHLLSYFAAICAFSYMEGQHSFTKDKLESYLNMANSVDQYNKRVVSDEFIHDITMNAGMMYWKDNRFYFISSVIQEYFCAKYYLDSPVQCH